jgi:hypothetical protein
VPRRRSGAQARCAWTVAPCGGVRTRGRGWTRPWGGRPPIRAPTHDPVSLTGIYDIVEVVDDVLACRAVERGVVRPGRVGAWCLVAQGDGPCTSCHLKQNSNTLH